MIVRVAAIAAAVCGVHDRVPVIAVDHKPVAVGPGGGRHDHDGRGSLHGVLTVRVDGGPGTT